MLPVLVIGNDFLVRRQLKILLEQREMHARVMEPDLPPSLEGLQQCLKQTKTRAVFLIVSNEEASAVQAAAKAVWLGAGIPVIAVARDCDPDVQTAVLKAGARAFLNAPFVPYVLRETIERALEGRAPRNYPRYNTGNGDIGRHRWHIDTASLRYRPA